MKFRVFWDILLCSHRDVDGRFRGACCLHHQADDRRTSETSVDISVTTRQYIPGDSELNTLLNSIADNITVVLLWQRFLRKNTFYIYSPPIVEACNCLHGTVCPEQEISLLYLIQRVAPCSQKPYSSQMNSIYIFTFYIFEAHFNVI
jgi:hypothetical protein